MQIIEVSIDVMWEFVSKQMSQEEFVKRWKDSSSGREPSGPSGWMIKISKEDPPMQWDVSVLSYAILNCKDLKLDESQKKSVLKLRDIRNRLFHRHRIEIDYEEYVEMLRESVESYKGLLDKADRLLHVQCLEEINNRET